MTFPYCILNKPSLHRTKFDWLAVWLKKKLSQKEHSGKIPHKTNKTLGLVRHSPSITLTSNGKNLQSYSVAALHGVPLLRVQPPKKPIVALLATFYTSSQDLVDNLVWDSVESTKFLVQVTLFLFVYKIQNNPFDLGPQRIKTGMFNRLIAM